MTIYHDLVDFMAGIYGGSTFTNQYTSTNQQTKKKKSNTWSSQYTGKAFEKS